MSICRTATTFTFPPRCPRRSTCSGAVKQPQAVGFSDQVTIISAIANAKGLLPNAYAQRAVIIRGSLNSPQVATVNIRDILAGKAPNLVLEPRDIVWMPNSPWERLGDFTKLIVSTFVRTVAANEGARSAASNAQPVQSNISLNPATASALISYNISTSARNACGFPPSEARSQAETAGRPARSGAGIKSKTSARWRAARG